MSKKRLRKIRNPEQFCGCGHRREEHAGSMKKGQCLFSSSLIGSRMSGDCKCPYFKGETTVRKTSHVSDKIHGGMQETDGVPNDTAKRDFEWIAAFQDIDTQIAFTGNPKRYVDAVLAPVFSRLRAESKLAVKLRNRCEELNPGSSSDEDMA